eukprot:TRINITY_DN10753_c0_g1_i1.p1 TRINITY_DN10753_c0_g1~~TRINITY_DN10753_c0_g1_i1.p1  ORF type:complete len:372 (-),score=32.66 TRINITY_DN10753_c0_g1_i1:1269-2384(-)
MESLVQSFVLKAQEGAAKQFNCYYGSDLVLRQEVTLLGRAVPQNKGYRFPSSWVQVSSHHCKLIVKSAEDVSNGQEVYVEDSSTNGTFINDVRISKGGAGCTKLNIGDVLSLSVGETALRYVLETYEGNRQSLQQEQHGNEAKRQKLDHGFLPMDGMNRLIEQLRADNEQLRSTNEQLRTTEAQLNSEVIELQNSIQKERIQYEQFQTQVQKKQEEAQKKQEEANIRFQEVEQNLLKTNAQLTTTIHDKAAYELQLQQLQVKNQNLSEQVDSYKKQVQQQQQAFKTQYENFCKRIRGRFFEIQSEFEKELRGGSNEEDLGATELQDGVGADPSEISSTEAGKKNAFISPNYDNKARLVQGFFNPSSLVNVT